MMERFLVALTQIDWVKNLVQFSIYIVMIALFFIFFIAPKMEELKRANIDFRKAEIYNKQITNENSARTEELKKIQSENLALLMAFKNRFEDAKIVDSLGGFFEEFNIVQKWHNKDEDGFIFTKLKVETTLKSSFEFYQFLVALNSSGYIVRAEFPIQFSGNRDRIKNVFYLNIYSIE